jgi:hypothetical protein
VNFKQKDSDKDDATPVAPDCAQKKADEGWDDCMCGQVCEMVKAYNESKHPKKTISPSPSQSGSKGKPAYDKSISDFKGAFAKAVNAKPPDPDAVKKMFYSPPPPAPPDCQYEKWKAAGSNTDPASTSACRIQPDHMHPASLNGLLTKENLKWADSRVNRTVGGGMNKLDPAPDKIKADPSCNCA